MNRIYPLVPPNELVDLMLGFPARSIVIQNPLPVWWYLPNHLTYVPPYASQMIVAMGDTEVVNVRFQSPPSIAQAPINLVEGEACFEYTSEPLAPSPGYSGSAAFATGSQYSVYTLDGTNAPASTSFVLPKSVDGLTIVSPLAFNTNGWYFGTIRAFGPDGAQLGPIGRFLLAPPSNAVNPNDNAICDPFPYFYPIPLPANSRVFIDYAISTGRSVQLAVTY